MNPIPRFLMPLCLALVGCLLATGAGWAEEVAQDADDSAQSRVVVRTLPDGTVQVVQVGADGEEKAEPSKSDDDGLEALAAIAQRLRMADAAEQGLDASSQPGSKTRQAPGRPVMRPRTGADRLGLQERLRVQSAPQASGTSTAGTATSNTATATTAQGVPCLAKSDVDPEVDPCEVAQRIGRLQPCRTPKECEAYDLWRQQYGAPGLRAAKPAHRATKPANPKGSDDEPRR